MNFDTASPWNMPLLRFRYGGFVAVAMGVVSATLGGVIRDVMGAGHHPIAVTDIQKIIFHLRDRGIGVLITDHNVRETLRITDRAYIVHDGTIYRSGTPDALASDADVRRIYLGTEFRLD